MSFDIMAFGILTFLAMSGGAMAKNRVEDELTAGSDAFTRWDPLFQKYGAAYGVPWPMLKAIAMNESSLGTAPSVARGLAAPNDIEGSKSSDGKSWGLMQLTLPTARDYMDVTQADLNNPDLSVELAAMFLSDLQRQFDSEEYVVKSYNQGAGNSRKELRGQVAGYAGEYWARYERNRRIIRDKQGV